MPLVGPPFCGKFRRSMRRPARDRASRLKDREGKPGTDAHSGDDSGRKGNHLRSRIFSKGGADRQVRRAAGGRPPRRSTGRRRCAVSFATKRIWSCGPDEPGRTAKLTGPYRSFTQDLRCCFLAMSQFCAVPSAPGISVGLAPVLEANKRRSQLFLEGEADSQQRRGEARR